MLRQGWIYSKVCLNTVGFVCGMCVIQKGDLLHPVTKNYVVLEMKGRNILFFNLDNISLWKNECVKKAEG